MVIRTTITSDDNDIRLDRWFKRHYSKIPFTIIAKLLRKGQIRLDGKRAQPATRITADQILTYPPLAENMFANTKKTKTKDLTDPKLIALADQLKQRKRFLPEQPRGSQVS